MLVKERKTDHLVEILDIDQLFDPFSEAVKGRYNVGEDLPEPESFVKRELVFCSGEDLPRCWLDPHYREASGGTHAA
jgi:hypothetical protein